MKTRANYVSARGATLHFNEAMPDQLKIAIMFAETLTAHGIQPTVYRAVAGIRARLSMVGDGVSPPVSEERKTFSATTAAAMDRKITAWFRANPEWKGSPYVAAKKCGFSKAEIPAAKARIYSLAEKDVLVCAHGTKRNTVWLAVKED